MDDENSVLDSCVENSELELLNSFEELDWYEVLLSVDDDNSELDSEDELPVVEN